MGLIKKTYRKLKRRFGRGKSCLDMLKAGAPGLEGHNDKSDKNSDSKVKKIRVEDVRTWDDFPTIEEIEALWENDEELEDAITRPVTQEELTQCTTGIPIGGGNFGEQSFERVWAPVQHRLNLISHVCAKD